MKSLLSILATLGLASASGAQSIPASAGHVLFSSEISRGSQGDQFGRSCASVGDIDNDGVIDLAVGASHVDDGFTNAGAVWILFMNLDGSVRLSRKISATLGGFTGPLNTENQFGKSVVGLGDMDGDGVPDIAVGATSSTTTTDRAVYTLFLNSNGTVKSWSRISNTTQGFGRAMTNMGDHDGDGIVDLMIGSGQGRVWLYYLNADGTEKSSRTYFARNDSTSGLPNFYGIGVSAIGDWDGDGVTDALIGDTGNDLGGTDLGVLFLSLANSGGFPNTEIPLYDSLPGFNLGLADYPNFGRDGCLVGDLDGNGVQDLAIGCSEWYGDGDPFDSGAVFIAFMEASGAILDHRRISLTSGNLGQPISSGVEFGICVSPLGDINGDGIEDIAVGARFGGSGSLYLLRLNDGTLEFPQASGTTSVNSGNLPLAVQFTDTSTGTVTGWQWDFGDGNSSNLQNPLHTYTTEGSFQVSLTVTGPGMMEDTRMFPGAITVGPNLDVTADFSSNTVQGGVPLNVSFTDTSVGIVDDWLWDFGDGNSSTLQNPSHTYTAVGTYDVSLSVSNSGESDMLTRPGWINAQPPAPTAAFSADLTSGIAPLSVSFTDQSTDLPTSWLWDFGDGATSTLQNPSHVYGEGTFSVTLTATNATGSDVLLQTDLISVAPPAPVASFTASTMGGGQPLMVQFTDQSSEAPDTWSWDFGDGNLSSAQSPLHTYTTTGSFQVSLVASNPSGSSMYTLPSPIIVVANPPVASFSANSSGGVTPLPVQFTDTSSDEPYTWTWDFGDGNQSTEQNPLHTYTTPGNYTVTLTVGNPLGSDMATAPVPIVVVPPSPVASFSVDVDEGIVPLSVSFSDTSTESPTAWMWDFGDGNSSTLQNPVHTYTAIGDYSVTLDVSNAGGSSQFTLPAPIMVKPVPPAADFVADVFNGQTPLTVQFTDLTTLDPTAWSWQFGDGTVSNLQHPSHTYTQPGVYNVSLSVVAPTGMDTEKKFNYIFPGLVTGISGAQFEAQLPNNTPVQPWVIGLGAEHTIQNSHKLSQPGMPTQGVQWLRLSAAGSEDAKAPSQPGGVTEPARGGAGVEQSFLLPPDRFVLCFEASFELNGPLASAEYNDWMSVDISDGETTVNLFYRDSFSEFAPKGLGNRLPTTKVETVRADLARLFPHARGGTALTLSMQVGNGGDALMPSYGHLDDFRFVPGDLLQVYGDEGNPSGSMAVRGRARLGESIYFDLDNPLGTQCAGSTRVELFVSLQPDAAFPAGSPQPNMGMGPEPGSLLIDWMLPGNRLFIIPGGLWRGAGRPTSIELMVPMEPTIVGLEIFAQGLFVDSAATCGTRLGLTRAVRMVIGP